MTICTEKSDPADRRSPPGCLLAGLGAGGAGDPGGQPAVERAAARLAQRLAVARLPLDGQAGADDALAALTAAAESADRGWLAALPVDVGRPLADGSCWAQALGAWRLPVLLVIPADQLASGLPAAASALLRQWRVPLLGLLQWGGNWQAEERRRDGLLWLGWLDSADAATGADQEVELALVAALGLRMRRLSAPESQAGAAELG